MTPMTCAHCWHNEDIHDESGCTDVDSEDVECSCKWFESSDETPEQVGLDVLSDS